MKKRFVHLLLAISFLFTAAFIPSYDAGAAAVIQRRATVSGGTSHSIALREDGTIWAWGSNQQLQLGMSSDFVEQPTPSEVDLEEASYFVSVAAGFDFSLALHYDGSVSVFGEGGHAPVYKVPLLTDVIAIAAGQTDGLALDISGAVWQWTIGEVPRTVLALNGIAAIAAGGAHFFALTYSGDVWGWGANWSGQLGDGTTTDVGKPKKLESLANIVYIAAGYSHSLAISHNGSVLAWGSNTYGQLGNGTTEAHSLPFKVSGLENVVQVSAGNETSMALTRGSEIYTWGYGEFGQLGNDTLTVSQDTPVKIATKGAPIEIASGVYHSFYITEDGGLYSWGRNRNNMLGTGDKMNKTEPVQVLASMAHDSITGINYPPPMNGVSPWAVTELTSLYKMDVLPPMLWGDYQSNVTRAEFAGLLVNLYEEMLGKEIAYPDRTNFEDIQNHAYEIEIRKAYQIELVSGLSETQYNPEGRISRQEAAKMIVTFICIVEVIPQPIGFGSLHLVYKDAAKIGVWAAPFVWFAYENDVMQGSGLNFDPLSNLTREQILAMVYRTILKYDWVLGDD